MIFLKVKNSYNKKLVTWLDLNLQVALGIKTYIYRKILLVSYFYSFVSHLEIISLVGPLTNL